MSDGGDCRTVLATPGLLITEVFVEQPLASPGSPNNIAEKVGKAGNM